MKAGPTDDSSSLTARGAKLPGRAIAERGGADLGGEREFSSAFENAAIGMSVVAPDSRRLRVNRAFCAMLGYAEAEMLACTVHDITHPDDVAEDLRQRGLCLAGEKESYQREKRYRRRDGHIVWGHLTCTLVRDAGGQPRHFVSQVQDITERKLAEQALRRSEQRFRSLILLSSDWYWEQDEHFRFTDFSGNTYAGPWRPDQEAAIGKCRWELEGVEPIGHDWEAHRAAHEAHQSFREFEYKVARSGAPARYLASSGEPMFDDDGRFVGYRGTARDVTERRQADQLLHDALATLRMAAQIGRLGAWSWELGRERLNWSPEVCAIHDLEAGFSPTHQEALAFFVPKSRELIRRTTLACKHEGSRYDVEAQVVTAKGRTIWVRVIAEAERDAQGAIWRLNGACQDISEGKNAAEETRLMAEQLTTTLESLTDAFITIDRDRRITFVNSEAERLMRAKRADLLGRRLLEIYPELAETSGAARLERAIRENTGLQFEEYYPLFGAWLQVKVFPSSQGLAIQIKDVTERVAARTEILRLNAELEQRVKDRTAQLEAANKELEAFSYSIAHDVRAPLSTIDGFTRLLEQAGGNAWNKACQHYHGRIRAGVRQMSDLTEGLLSLASLSRASPRSEAVDLAVLARTHVAACQERNPERAADIVIASTLPVQGDPQLLSQLIGNLVGNAWKFTAGREPARIEIGVSPGPDGNAVYFVRDNGAGFDPAHAARMFEPFQRMHTASEFEGTGIGLAISYRVVSRHGGRIWAESMPLQGACFYFTLGK